MYAATIEGRRLTFEVYGVWRKNMVMTDRETGSIWQHATGEAIDGPLKGKRLEVLPVWETQWGELQAGNPQAQYALEPEHFSGVMPKPVLMHALQVTHVARLDGLLKQDLRLDAHEVVIGLAIDGEAKAYPMQALRSARSIMDRVGGINIQIDYSANGDRVIVRTQDGTSLLYEKQWWLGWSEFHPRSAIWRQSQ